MRKLKNLVFTLAIPLLGFSQSWTGCDSLTFTYSHQSWGYSSFYPVTVWSSGNYVIGDYDDPYTGMILYE